MPKNNKILIVGEKYESCRCACGFYFTGHNLGVRIKLHRKKCPAEAEAVANGVDLQINRFQTTHLPDGRSRENVISDVYRQRDQNRLSR